MTDATNTDSMFNRRTIAPEYEYIAITDDHAPDQARQSSDQALEEAGRLPTARKFKKDNQLYLPFIKTVSTAGFGKKRREAFFENERKLKDSRTETEKRLFIRVFRDAEIEVRTGKQIRRTDITKKLFAFAAVGLAAKAAYGGFPGISDESPFIKRRPDSPAASTTSVNLDSKFAPTPSTAPEATVENTVPALPTTTSSLKTPETTTTVAPEASNITFSEAGLTCRGMWMIVDMRTEDHNRAKDSSGEDDRSKWFYAAQRASQDKDLWPSLNKERATAIWAAIQKHEKNKDHGGTIPAAVGTLAFFPNDCEPWKLPGE